MTIAMHSASTAARNTGLLTFMDSGAGVATLRIYPAPRRALVIDPVGVSMIVAVPLLKPSASIDAAGVMTLLSTGAGLNLISEMAAWAILVNGNGETVFDCDVSAAGGTGDIILSAAGASGLNLYSGGETSLSSGTLA